MLDVDAPAVNTNDILATFRTVDPARLDQVKHGTVDIDGLDPFWHVAAVSTWRGDLIIGVTGDPERGLSHTEFLTQVALATTTPGFRASRPVTLAHRGTNGEYPLRGITLEDTGMTLHAAPTPGLVDADEHEASASDSVDGHSVPSDTTDEEATA